MDTYLYTLLLAALPAIGNFSGGIIAELVPVSKRTLSVALHAAAGIIFAVVGIELIPRSIENANPLLIMSAFVAGGGLFILMDKTIHIIEARMDSDAVQAGQWSIFFAVSVDLFTDGVMVGAGNTVSFELALLLALGQVSADIPEGFATIANFKSGNIARKIRLMISAGFVVPVFLGATTGYWAVRGAPDIYKYLLLALTAGILLTAAVEEMLVEAHEAEDTPMMSMALVSGFALFAVITKWIG